MCTARQPLTTIDVSLTGANKLTKSSWFQPSFRGSSGLFRSGQEPESISEATELQSSVYMLLIDRRCVYPSLISASYYKCKSSRCGAKQHVEKSREDPEVLIITYEGPHLHGPQPVFPRRQWAGVDLSCAGKKPPNDKDKSASSSLAASSAAARASDDGGGGWLLPTSQRTTRDAKTTATAAARDQPPPGPRDCRPAGDAVSRQHLALTADSCDDGSTASCRLLRRCGPATRRL